jgi:hypothetical protein
MLTRARVRNTVAVAVATVIAATGLAAGAQAAVAPISPDPIENFVEPNTSITLSDEETITRWAHATETEPIRVAPNASAPVITKLRYETEDREPEVYLVLDGVVDADGNQWLHIRIPMKPNGRTGWVPIDMLSELFVVRTQLEISRASKKAVLRKDGRIVWQAPVGIGKSGTPTPTGDFWIRELLKGGNGAYGPWAFGTSAYSNIREWRSAPVVGIHGTNEPGLIPGAPSHGCVRVRNDKINQLAKLMPIGTPVKIS